MQHLEITDVDKEYELIFVGGFRGFSGLLMIGGTNASDVGEMTATGLTDFLPPSIETLYFTHCEHLEEM